MKPIGFILEAEHEMLEAARYYESQAFRMRNAECEMRKAKRKIFLFRIPNSAFEESPMTWLKVEGELRRRLVRRFPFGILYRNEPDAIVIVAAAHLRRKPGYWKRRI